MSIQNSWVKLHQALPALLACSMILTIGRGLTLPFVAVYFHNNLGYSIEAAGTIITVGVVLGIIASFFLGTLVDHYPRKRVAWLSILAMFLGFMGLMIFPQSLLLVLNFALINGAYAVFSIVLKCVVAEKDPMSKMRYFSMNYTFTNVGWVVGPLLGALFVRWDTVAPYWAAALVTLPALYLILSAKGMNRDPQVLAIAKQQPKFKKFVIPKDFWLLMFTLGGILAEFVYSRYPQCFSQVIMAQNYSEQTAYSVVTTLLAVNAMVVVLFQYSLNQYLHRKNQIVVSIVVGGMALALALGIFSQAQDKLFIWGLGMVFFTVGEMIFLPLQYFLVDRIAPEHQKAHYFAVQNFTTLGGAANPMVTGILLVSLNIPSVFVALYIGLGLFCFIFIIGYLRTCRSPQ